MNQIVFLLIFWVHWLLRYICKEGKNTFIDKWHHAFLWPGNCTGQCISSFGLYLIWPEYSKACMGRVWKSEMSTCWIVLKEYWHVVGFYTPRFNEVERGYTGFTSSICLSVCPSVCLWTESCPLCIFNNTRRIHFIFTHLIKQLQKVCCK